MKTIIIIPARFASSRYPGKPLVELKLPNGEQRSLIELTWRAAGKVNDIHDIFIATDDTRIATAVRAFGAKVIMTSSQCKNGTERCAEAVDNAKLDADLIINFQGDAPLTPPWFVDSLIESMHNDDKSGMATPVVRLDRLTYGHFIEDRKKGLVGGTTAVFGVDKYALYFSKEVIPFVDLGELSAEAEIPVFHHVGIYAYKPNALKSYMDWPVGKLEELEGLEQLRFLENNQLVKCVSVSARGRVFWELNNPNDVKRIEKVIGDAL